MKEKEEDVLKGLSIEELEERVEFSTTGTGDSSCIISTCCANEILN